MFLNKYHVIVVIGIAHSQAVGPEARLMQDIFNGYDNDARPVKDTSGPIVINVVFGLGHIESLVSVSGQNNPIVSNSF